MAQPGKESLFLGGEKLRDTPRPHEELTSLGLGVKKTDRAGLQSTDKKGYYKVRDTAIEGLPSKFTLLKGISETATMEHFESVYSVVTCFEDLKTKIVDSDMIDVFSILSLFTEDSGTGTFLPSGGATLLDLFTEASKVSLDLVQKANAFYLEFGQDYHGENIVWSGEKILNSCDTELRDKLIESTRSWDKKYKGGPTYLKLLLGLILSTSQKSLRSLTDKLQILKITDFPGENVSKAVSFIQGAALILSNNEAAPPDLMSLVLRIFSKSTCAKFRVHIDNINSLIELNQLTAFTLDQLLTSLDKKYIELVSRNEWTPLITSPNSSSSFMAGDKALGNLRRIICFNCGGIGHPVADCPQPRNDAMIELRKSIMGDYNKSRSSKTPNPLLIPPKKGESHSKYINGTLLHWCGRGPCRKWTDHPTSEHPPDLADTSSESANAASTNNPPSSAPSTSSLPTNSNQQTTESTNEPPSSVLPSSADSVSAYSASMAHFW